MSFSNYLTKSPGSMINKSKNSSNSYMGLFSEFEDLACEALKQSYEISDVNTEIVLIRRIDEFSGLTCLQMAISAECIKFVSEPAFQGLLVKLWYENLSPFTSTWRVFESSS